MRSAPADFNEFNHVAEELLPIHADLVRWALWATSRATPIGSCGSAERNYRSPWRQYHYPDLYNQSQRISDFQGIEIERAVSALPERQRKVIRLWYIRKAHIGQIRGAAGVPFGKLLEFVNSARRMVRNNLTRRVHSVIKPPQSDIRLVRVAA